MKLSQKVRYGLGCLSELAKRSGEVTDASHIADAQKIPTAYTQKILQMMAGAGIVLSQKGHGYKLARPLTDITAGEIIDLLTSDVDPNASNPDLGIRLEERLNSDLRKLSLQELL